MIVYCFLAGTLLVALFSIFLVWNSAHRPLNYGWHSLLLSVSLGCFIYLYGTWVFLSVYLKYLFAAVFLISFCVAALREKRKSASRKRLLPSLVLTTVLLLLIVLYFIGSTGTPRKVALSFPLKKGRYFLLQGGKGLPTNIFHYTYRGAVYALDIVKLNDYGNRARKVFSRKLEDYEIFNDTAYSPCTGKVIRIKDENPDNTPSIRKRGPSNINQVVIETDSFFVFLGHFKEKGVLVREGDMIKTGEPLGIVGNSGFSLEPHLHIQAHENSHSGLPWYREAPLYIEFDGKSYLLFEVIRPRRVKMMTP